MRVCSLVRVLDSADSDIVNVSEGVDSFVRESEGDAEDEDVSLSVGWIVSD